MRAIAHLQGNTREAPERQIRGAAWEKGRERRREK